ncbi:DHH family phosphoesterase [Candidatus Woesearchaeota archaeon]|nr:DHH family phosphoesterase [Candidatus Woesearchaeota archaeon]
MDKYEEFKKEAKKAVELFKQLDKNETIRVICHIDADGISACAILIKTLNLDNRKYSISTIQQVNNDVLVSLSKEPYKYIIFADIGAGSLEAIKEKLPDKRIFILDHHEYDCKEIPENVTLLNPHMFDIDGGKEISGSGVVYFFCKNLNEGIENLAHIAIVGALGDIQEKGGFFRLNDEILRTAVNKGNIDAQKGLRLFGSQTRPIHKVLEYSTDPYIPGVSGSESGSIQFLHQIGIEPKNGKNWKKIVHLDEEEMKKLVGGIIMKRFGESKPDDVLGNVYLLPKEKEESPLKDAREFATLLNACGRMGKASLGIGACLGDRKTQERAVRSLTDYKREIVNGMNWYRDNQDSNDFIKGNGFIIINAKDQVLPTIIGTIASIISKSNDLKEGTFVLSMAQLVDGTTKVSLRIAGYRNQGVDLSKIVQSMTSRIEGAVAGGHMQAAGALLPSDKEAAFIEIAKEILEREALEERVD